jgi:hypothetical protein
MPVYGQSTLVKNILKMCNSLHRGTCSLVCFIEPALTIVATHTLYQYDESKTVNCLLYFVMYYNEYVRKSDNLKRVLIIGLCILLRVYQLIYVETSVRNKCRCSFYCVLLTLHVSVPIGGHLQVVCNTKNSKAVTVYVNGSVASVRTKANAVVG